jgi:DNA-binding SARP family transcriptional activator
MLELTTFGDPKLRGPDGTLLNGITRQTKRFALLIFLACDRDSRRHRREEILTVFWPESDRSSGRNALRQALHVLREDLGSDVVGGDGSEALWVDGSKLSCDVSSFSQAISNGSPELALRIYQADFLVGFEVQGCPEFGSWADERRTELKDMASKAAQDLAYQAEGKEDSKTALHWWKRALELRPFDESMVRRVMSLLTWTDNRGAAHAEFHSFRKRLAAELSLEPSSATLELMRKISDGRIEDVPQWVGDRRRGSQAVGEPHWRRLGDSQ